MAKKLLGFIGWRGMVGSVLQDRIKQVGPNKPGDTQSYETHFFSTSQAGQAAPDHADNKVLLDAFDIKKLQEMDVIVTSQGGDYTNKVFRELRDTGWNGFWIDAASSLRMEDEAIICLSPVNAHVIKQGIDKGVRTFVGGNCTVSLLLMALGPFMREGHVDWISTMTYQAASGSGARHMRELITQMGALAEGADQLSNDIIEWEKQMTARMRSEDFPTDHFPVPLAGGLIPWIDTKVASGQSKEEWKAQVEANKILGYSGDSIIPIDGTCVRVGALRCHSQAVTMKLNKNIPLNDIEDIIKNTSEWTKFIANDPEQTMRELNPAFVSGELTVPVGRVRKMSMGDEYINLFTCGDQLLWGAAEPLRCMLEHIQEL